MSPDNAARTAAVLQAFGFEGARPEDFQPGAIVRMGVPPVRIEVQCGISGVEFAACLARCLRATLDGVPVRILSKSDLIANKKAAGRPKDLNDVRHLEGRP